MANVEYIFDIDQTLAGGIVPAHMRLYSRRLGLPMDEAAIAATEAYARTFDVQEIIDYRARGDIAEANFQAARAEIRTSREVHLAFNELPGSAEGVRVLICDGEATYYTVRPREVEGATKEWLAMKGFPDSENVVICDSPEDKLRRVIQDKLVTRVDEGELSTIVIIDDSYRQLAEAAVKIVNENQDMKHFMEHIILVGFGTDNPSAILEGSFNLRTGIRTLGLPAWTGENINRLKPQVEN